MDLANLEWLSRASTEAAKPVEVGERIFGVAIVVVSILMIVFLAKHISSGSGFITRDLTVFESFLLYGYWIAWIITATLDSLLNQRLLSRLFDSFGGILFMALSSLYFFVVFPFDFAYVAVVLPESLQFLVAWVGNNLGRVILGMAGVAMLIASVYSPIAYKIINLVK